MPYEVLLQRAHSIVDEIPHEKIEYIVQFLQNAKGIYSSTATMSDAKTKSQAAFSRLQKNRHFNSGIDYDKELERSRTERFL